MANYVLTYHGGSGMPESPEEQEKLMAAWGAWIGAAGEKMPDPGNPIAAHKTVSPDGSVADGGPADALSGYGILSVDSFDEAVAIAKGCPILEAGGSVQVSETIAM